jgi:hypothetical protein
MIAMYIVVVRRVNVKLVMNVNSQHHWQLNVRKLVQQQQKQQRRKQNCLVINWTPMVIRNQSYSKVRQLQHERNCIVKYSIISINLIRMYSCLCSSDSKSYLSWFRSGDLFAITPPKPGKSIPLGSAPMSSLSALGMRSADRKLAGKHPLLFTSV